MSANRGGALRRDANADHPALAMPALLHHHLETLTMNTPRQRRRRGNVLIEEETRLNISSSMGAVGTLIVRSFNCI